jgi:hypothetical protein
LPDVLPSDTTRDEEALDATLDAVPFLDRVSADDEEAAAAARSLLTLELAL